MARLSTWKSVVAPIVWRPDQDASVRSSHSRWCSDVGRMNAACDPRRRQCRPLYLSALLVSQWLSQCCCECCCRKERQYVRLDAFLKNSNYNHHAHLAVTVAAAAVAEAGGIAITLAFAVVVRVPGTQSCFALAGSGSGGSSHGQTLELVTPSTDFDVSLLHDGMHDNKSVSRAEYIA